MATVGSDSLRNMSVNNTDNVGLLMPKLQFRFRVNFLNFGNNDTLSMSRQVIDCARPQVQFQEITLPVYNSTLYLAGKATWQTLAINIRDDASGNIQRAVGTQLQRQMDFAEQASAASGGDYKFTTRIDILDGGNGQTGAPVELETWELYGCFIQTANYNTLNYATNEAVTIALTLRYDNAIQYGMNGTALIPTTRAAGTGSSLVTAAGTVGTAGGG
jgi:hypothetical protein